MKNIISTERAPKAIGPYSQAVVSNGLAFLSGQIPLDPATNQIIDGRHRRADRARAGESEERPRSGRFVTRPRGQDHGLSKGYGRVREDERGLRPLFRRATRRRGRQWKPLACPATYRSRSTASQRRQVELKFLPESKSDSSKSAQE